MDPFKSTRSKEESHRDRGSCLPEVLLRLQETLRRDPVWRTPVVPYPSLTNYAYTFRLLSLLVPLESQTNLEDLKEGYLLFKSTRSHPYLFNVCILSRILM